MPKTTTLPIHKRPFHSTEGEGETEVKNGIAVEKCGQHGEQSVELASFRGRAAVLATTISDPILRSYLQLYASGGVVDLDMFLPVGKVILDQVEKTTISDEIRGRLKIALDRSLFIGNKIKSMQDARMKKLTDYAAWTQQHKRASSQTHAVREEAQKRREEIERLKVSLDTSEEEFTQIMGEIKKIEDVSDALLKEIQEAVGDATAESRVWYDSGADVSSEAARDVEDVFEGWDMLEDEDVRAAKI